MRRIVVEKGYTKQGEYFQVCVVYPKEINMKQAVKESKGLTTKIGIISFEDKKPKYMEVTK
jgi:hypothetical protein